MSSLVRLQQRCAQAYLAHRLNQPELQQVVACLQQGDSRQARQLLDHYSHPEVDWRGPTALSREQAEAYLGLDRKMEDLRDDRIWDPLQRAVYRRLSAPDHDPSLVPEGRSRSGDPLFVKTALRNFAKWDLDGNGQLTSSELDLALAGPTSPALAATLVMLRLHNPKLAACVKDRKKGTTRADLEAFGKTGLPDRSVGLAAFNAAFRRRLERARKMPPARPLAREGKSGKDIAQGGTSSCVMLATLPALGSMKHRITDLHDGTFEVAFGDGSRQVVEDLSLAERLYHSQGRNGARWPGLLEMAMGQRVREQDGTWDGTVRSGADYLEPAPTLRAMTGRRSRFLNLETQTPNGTRKWLREFAQQKRVVICGSRDGWGENDRRFTVESLHNGIVNNHAYSILGYNAKTDRVKLQNPWHHQEWVIQPDNQDDGVFEMPLRDFYSSFRWVASAPKPGPR